VLGVVLMSAKAPRADSKRHLPWTPGTLYGWMKSKIGGMNIRTGISNSYCCDTQFGVKPYIAIQAQNDGNRDFDRPWRGIAGRRKRFRTLLSGTCRQAIQPEVDFA